jgi:hypothetical protein
MRLQPVTLKPKQVVMRADRPIEYVYFPVQGVVSALTVMSDGSAIEVACIGSEGLAGVSIVLGSMVATHDGIVQVKGEALRTRASTLAEVCASDATLRGLML